MYCECAIRTVAPVPHRCFQIYCTILEFCQKLSHNPQGLTILFKFKTFLYKIINFYIIINKISKFLTVKSFSVEIS